MSDILDLQTPAFLIDRAVFVANCDRMRNKAAASGVAFRPHVKTHKTIEGARLQLGGAPGPITVSTLAEAEFFAGAGFRDITYAVPIAPSKLDRVEALGRNVEALNILIDHIDAFDALERHHARTGAVFDVFVKIDCGYHRSGLSPESPATFRLLNAVAGSPAARLRGLLTHAGHAYHARNSAEIAVIAEEEAASVAAVARTMDSLGVRGLIRSVGSTPTASVPSRLGDFDEVRPGNYVFYDAFQAAIGSCSLSDCAATVLTTVIGSYSDHMIVDAGALALSKDPGPVHIDPRCGYGVVCDSGLHRLPLVLTELSQEHGKIEGRSNAELVPLPVGTRLRIIPNHSCLTAAMFDRYVVLDGAAIIEEWHPVRGW